MKRLLAKNCGPQKKSDLWSSQPLSWQVTGFLFALLAGILWSGACPLLAQDITLVASVSRNPVGVDETFTYELKVSGATQSLPDVQLPPLDPFKILSGPNQSSQFSMVNGAVSVSKSYSVVLLPRRTGKFTIPAVRVTHKGRTYLSNAIELEVTSSGALRGGGNPARPGAKDSDDLFIRAIPSKTTVYVNDQINVSYKVYFRVPIRNPDFLKFPETIGFWVEEYEVPQNIPVTHEVINGVQYNVAEVKKFALFPTRAGELTITPLQLSVDVVKRRQRDPFSMFDDFFDNPLGRTERKVLSSPEITLDVKPLPAAGRPANFSGLVGNFQLVVNLDKTSVKANEAITYKVRISGSGNLKSLNTLNINFPPNFQVFDPRVNDSINRKTDRLYFTREMEYVLIPRDAGQYRLPPLELSFFDPGNREYRVLRSREFLVEVAEGDKLAAGSANFTKSEVRLLGQDIHFIKENELDLVPVDYKPYATVWFWAALLLPLLVLGVAVGYRSHSEKMSTNVEYARKRQASKQAIKRLKTARALLQQGNYAAFYGAVSSALLGFVADKTNHAAAGLMRDNVAALLAQNQVDRDMIDEYLKCLDEADFRRFAPGQVTPEAARQFYDTAAEVLSKLGKYFK